MCQLRLALEQTSTDSTGNNILDCCTNWDELCEGTLHLHVATPTRTNQPYCTPAIENPLYVAMTPGLHVTTDPVNTNPTSISTQRHLHVATSPELHTTTESDSRTELPVATVILSSQNNPEQDREMLYGATDELPVITQDSDNINQDTNNESEITSSYVLTETGSHQNSVNISTTGSVIQHMNASSEVNASVSDTNPLQDDQVSPSDGDIREYSLEKIYNVAHDVLSSLERDITQIDRLAPMEGTKPIGLTMFPEPTPISIVPINMDNESTLSLNDSHDLLTENSGYCQPNFDLDSTMSHIYYDVLTASRDNIISLNHDDIIKRKC